MSWKDKNVPAVHGGRRTPTWRPGAQARQKMDSPLSYSTVFYRFLPFFTDFYWSLPIFRSFLGDFNLQKLPSRGLWTLWAWKNRVLLEEYYIFNVAIPLTRLILPIFADFYKFFRLSWETFLLSSSTFFLQVYYSPVSLLSVSFTS